MSKSTASTDVPSQTLVALELFKVRSSQPGISSRQLAIDCFRAAKVFVEVAESAQQDEFDFVSDDTNPLDIAFAPNLKRTHPINLMSREWGDLGKVQAVLADLDANPATEFYELYGWGKPEIHQARALFPAVVNRLTSFSPQ